MLSGFRLVLLATATLASGAAAAEESAERRRPAIAIENVTIIDVVLGEVTSPKTVLLAGGYIAAISNAEGVAVPAGALRVDGRGRFLLPGLVDMHVHLFNNASSRPPNDWAFPLFIANGVTAVREMAARGEDLATVAGWKTAVDQGCLIAPRVVAAGVSANPTSEPAARDQARRAQQAGTDFLKVFSNIKAAPWRALLEEAGGLRLPVCGHIPAEVSVLDPLAGTQRSNEHLMQVFEACSAREREFLAARTTAAHPVAVRDAQELEVLEAFDQVACDRAADTLATRAQVQVPTLVLAHHEARGSPAQFRDDSRWKYLRSDEQTRWSRLLEEDSGRDPRLPEARREISLRITRTLHRAGVRVVAGTDAPMPLVYPGYSLHEELALLVEAGLSPAAALRSATIWPAEFLGLSEMNGSIATGKRADLVLLDHDPLVEISHTQAIRAVILDGRLLQRPDLDALLAPGPLPK